MEKELAKISTVLAITVDMHRKIIRWLLIALLLTTISTCATSVCLYHILTSGSQASIQSTTGLLTTTVKSRISKSKKVEVTAESEHVLTEV